MRRVLLFIAALSLAVFPAMTIAASHHTGSKRRHRSSRTRVRRSRSRHARHYRRARRRTYQLHPTAARYKQIQQALADKGYYHGEIDGEWGPQSISALQRFQTERGIENEGKVTALALIGLDLGPKHTHSIVPVVAPDTAQPADDSEISEEKQEPSALRPGNEDAANPGQAN